MEEKKSILSKPAVAYLLSIFVWMGWGSAPPLIKKCYSLFSISGTATPIVFGGMRFLCAGVVLFVISCIKNGHLPILSMKNVKNLLLLGTVQTTLASCFEYVALGYISGTNTSIVNATAPFCLIVFSALFFKSDKITFRKLIGIIVGFAGVMVCLAGGGSLSISFMGEGFVFIEVLFFCLGSVFSKVVAMELDPITTSAFNLLVGGTEMMVVGLISGGSMINGGFEGLAIFGILVLISTCCFMLWTTLCTVNPVSKLAPFQFLSPLMGAVMSGVVLGENILQAKYIVAIVLVCVGTLISTSTERKVN